MTKMISFTDLAARAYAKDEVTLEHLLDICADEEELKEVIITAEVLRINDIISEREANKKAEIEHSWEMLKGANAIFLEKAYNKKYNKLFAEENDRQECFNQVTDYYIPSDREIFILINAAKAAECKASHNKITEFFERYNLNLDEITIFYINYDKTYYDNAF